LQSSVNLIVKKFGLLSEIAHREGYGFREPEALSESLKGFGNYLAGVVI